MPVHVFLQCWICYLHIIIPRLIYLRSQKTKTKWLSGSSTDF